MTEVTPTICKIESTFWRCVKRLTQNGLIAVQGRLVCRPLWRGLAGWLLLVPDTSEEPPTDPRDVLIRQHAEKIAVWRRWSLTCGSS